MAMEKFERLCRTLGGVVKYKGKAPMAVVEEAVCYIPEDVSIVGITKVGDEVVFGFTRGRGVSEATIDGVEEVIAYDVEKAALDRKPSVEFGERPNKIVAEIYPSGKLRLFVD